MKAETQIQQETQNDQIDGLNSMEESTNYQKDQPDILPEKDYVNLKYRSAESLAADKLATGLGVFSIALGLAELLMPVQLGEMTGLDEKHHWILPLFGLREIASGVAILASQDPTTAVWSRVGGDGLDLALLGAGCAPGKANKLKAAAAIAAVAGVTLLDVMCAQKLGRVTADI